MGIDWLVEYKPQPGHEVEFDELFEIIRAGKHKDRRTFWARMFGAKPPPDYVSRYENIGVDPGETLGAPRVGRDAAADDWLRRLYDSNPARTETWTDYHKAMTGYYVLPLAQPCDGLPVYSNGGLATPLVSSFRAEYLADIVGSAPFDVDVGNPYDWQNASDLVKTGRRLEESARDYARRTGVGEEVFDRAFEPTEEELELTPYPPRVCVHILISASRWCAYWGERGHYMRAWF
ncbi:MAG: hypothetical protein ACTS3R_08825 [Inquilinaceae bacterium]